MALVSAHRGGAGDDTARENTLAAFEAAIDLGCDYVEFDVRLTVDGRPVLFHDDNLADGARRISRHRYDDLVDAQLVELVERIVTVLGDDNVIITTAEDSSVRQILRWSGVHAPDLLVGLSSSARAHGRHRLSRWRVRLESAFPRLRLRLSGANLVVAHKFVARWSLKAYARRRGMHLVVWTVDGPDELARWMNDPD